MIQLLFRWFPTFSGNRLHSRCHKSWKKVEWNLGGDLSRKSYDYVSQDAVYHCWTPRENLDFYTYWNTTIDLSRMSLVTGLLKHWSLYYNRFTLSDIPLFVNKFWVPQWGSSGKSASSIKRRRGRNMKMELKCSLYVEILHVLYKCPY